MRGVRTGTAAGLGWSFAAILLGACGGANTPDGVNLASCPAGTAIFTTSPVPVDDVYGWVPLGQLGPPAHTFPTDHQYIYVNNPDLPAVGPAVTVRSPGDVHIIRVSSSRFHEIARTDYSITFQPCAEISGYLGHVLTLVPGLETRLGPFDQFCNTYSPAPGSTTTQCQTGLLDIPLAAGEAMGTTGGVSGFYGLDFGLFDRRIPAHPFANSSRWSSQSDGFDRFHVVPPSDYFAEPARSAVAGKLGSYNGMIPRTAPPVGGTIAVDVPGTAQGAWFKPGQPTYPESAHLALAPDNVDPTFHVFSVGLSQPGPSTGAVRFQPVASGTVNRGFADVTPGPTIYCWEGMFYGLMLLRLDSEASLTLERRSGVPTTCADAAPLSLGPDAVRYDR